MFSLTELYFRFVFFVVFVCIFVLFSFPFLYFRFSNSFLFPFFAYAFLPFIRSVITLYVGFHNIKYLSEII